MDSFDKEIKIIEYFRDLDKGVILPLPAPLDDIEFLISTIIDDDKWKYWTDSSDKDAPPPDFYSDKYKIMMDVMRIDDNTFIGKKGKPVNPTQAKLSKVRKEIAKTGIFEENPEAEFYGLIDSGLPTEEDHNYQFYKNNFQRIVSKHIDSIPLYKNNHPNYKLVFFIFDESSMYMECEYEKSIPIAGNCTLARPHLWFEDINFINCFKGSGVDYIIWFAPYKRVQHLENRRPRDLILPKVVVYGKEYLNYQHVMYNENLIMSVEE